LLVGSAGAGLFLYGYQQHQNNEKNSLFTTVDEIYQSGLRKWDEFRQPTTTTTTTPVTSNESLLVVEPPVIESEKLSKQENESTVETNKTNSRPSDPARALLFDDNGRIKRRFI